MYIQYQLLYPIINKISPTHGRIHSEASFDIIRCTFLGGHLLIPIFVIKGLSKLILNGVGGSTRTVK